MKSGFLTAVCFLLAATAFLHAQGPSTQSASVAVGAQYDSTHVYVTPDELDAFVKSFTATFGGTASRVATVSVLPVPSSTEFQYVWSPVGTLSVFAFLTPIPFPFGQERTGYLVTDMDQAIQTSRSAGAEIIVEPFKDAIGRDAVIQWPGGLKMQFYWHFVPPKYPPLETIPENRVYISRDAADDFVKDFILLSHGEVIQDDRHADAGAIGSPGQIFRCISIRSLFGNMRVLVTDGHLPYPFGHEVMGYQVLDLAATLEKAKAAGVKILSAPYRADGRTAAIVEFPGGYIAEVHSFVALPATP
jgi:predicted enzyme related to lactoylglutathione lyase